VLIFYVDFHELQGSSNTRRRKGQVGGTVGGGLSGLGSPRGVASAGLEARPVWSGLARNLQIVQSRAAAEVGIVGSPKASSRLPWLASPPRQAFTGSCFPLLQKRQGGIVFVIA